MAKALPLPDGTTVAIREGETPAQAWERAQRMYPEAFELEEEKPTAKRDTTGLKAAASAGLERLKGQTALTAAKLGFKDVAEAEAYQKQQEAKAAARFTPTEQGWTEAPFLKFRETLGGSLPSMVAPAAAGLAALAAPVSVPVAAGLGLLGAGAVSAGQFTGSNLAAQLETGKSLEEASLGKAVGAAVPQALLDTAAMALLPGVGKLFGSVGSKLTNEQAKAIASQTLGKTIADYAAKTGTAMGREGVTEATQQVLERLQAGLSITDPEARKEYVESFIGGAVLGGALAPAGRAFERGGAKRQAAKAERDERNAAQAAAAEQERLAAEQEAAEKQTPEYALRVANQLKTLEQEKLGLQQQIRKVAKDSTTEAEDKAFNKEINQKLQENRRARDELAPEVNRLKKAGIYDQALEQERVAGLSPMDYMLERTGEVRDRKPIEAAADTAYEESGLAFQEPLVPSVERRKAEDAEKARVAAVPAAYAAERMRIAQEQRFDPTGEEYVEYLLQDPYKAGLVVETRTPLPGLTASESNLIRNALAKRLKAMGKEELAARQADLQAQKPSADPVNPMAQFLADQDMLDVARQEGMTESEIAFVERQAAMPRDTIEQGDLFGEQRVGQAAGVTEQRGNIADKMDELQRQLDIAYAQRNIQRGGQYRETIRGLIEQIRDLQARTALPTEGELGAATADLQGQLGQLPENLQAQREAEAARQAALARVANKEEGARSDTINALVDEIKAVRGALRPETITAIEKEADAILSTLERYGDQGDLLAYTQQELDRLSQKWRSGTVRGETATRTRTPTTTSAEMLREQMDRAFAQNDQSTRTERRERYAPQDMAVLNQIADNFNAFAASPDRLNMAGEWLNRLTTTGRSSPEMTRDLQAELARLEEGKRSETETPMRQTAFGLATKPTQTAQQLELPERFMPKAVAPQSETRVVDGKAQFVSPEDVGPLQGAPAERYSPAKKSTAFATAAEFQKYLASDALKVLRQAMGMGKDTASRMHARLALFSKKVENISKQLAALEARKAALESQRKADTGTALELLRTAEDNLKKIYERLDAELADLQTDYMQARQQFDFTAQTVSDIGQKIADNLEKFQSTDTAVVEAAQKTAEAKTAYATAIEQPVSKRTFSALRTARREVITAIEQQIVASRKAGADDTILAFLNADLNLQLQLQAEEKALDRDAQSLLNAGLALEEAAATQKRSRKNQKELKQAQQELAAALELKGDVAKEAGDIDTQLAQVQTDIAAAEKELDRVQKIADRTQTTRQAEAADRAEQERQSAFERKLAEIKIEPMSKAQRDEATAKDKAKLEAFQAMTARLSAIPGTRIDFSKRQQMLEAFNAHTDQEAQLTQDLKDVDTGIEEMQIAVAIAENAIADTAAGYTPEQVAKFQARIKTANERIEQLRAYGKRLEAQQVSMQKAYAKAVMATSSDPEIYQQVTKDLDARVEKLNKDIAENEARIAKGEAKSGKKAETKTLAQTRKRVANYKRELKRVEALRSNRLGIQRTDAVTGAPIGKAKRAVASPEQQELQDAEIQRLQEYGAEKERLSVMEGQLAAMKAAKEPRGKAKQEERKEKIRELQEKVNKQQAEVDRLAPRAVGTVSQATRVQSAAPGKFRTGTAESKATTGVNKQPVVEKRTVAQPKASEAVADANAFAERLLAAKTPMELADDFADQDLKTRAAILAAVDSNVSMYRSQIATLENERDALQASIDVAKDPLRIPVATRDRLAAVREELGIKQRLLAKAEGTKLQTEMMEYASLRAPAVEGGTGVSGFDMGVSDTTGDFDFDFDSRYRVAKTTGPSMSVAQVQKVYDALTGEWVNKPETIIVADERGLPVRILNQAKRDNMLGKIPGLYDPKSSKVYLVASNLRSVNDVILTTVHEIAGHFGLQSILGDTYTKTMNDIYNGNAAIRKAADAKMKQIASLKRETAVEEALAEQAELDPNAPDTRSAMRRIYDAIKKWARDVLGLKDTITDAQVNQIIANARKFVIEGGEAGKGVAGVLTPSYRSKATAPADALEELALKTIAQPKTLKEKLGNNIALQAEMNAVDMRAGLREALRFGDDRLFMEAMYRVRKAEQKMAQMFTVMNSGPLVQYTDSKGFIGYRSSNENSAIDVFDAIADIPKDSPQMKMDVAQMYMVAQRAQNKGLSKLDLGEMGIKEEDLKAALAAADANHTLKAALENVRRKYNAYNKGLIEFLALTGRISKKEAARLLKDGDYVPYYRVKDGNATLHFGNNVTFNVGDIRRQPYLAELKGGETKLLPLNEAIQQNTLLLTDMALTNNATKSVAYGLQALGKGKGPIDPKTGKPTNLMPIKPGFGPDGVNVIRFYQEPDPNKPDDDGKRHLVVDTKGTLAEGIPAEMVVQSLEGSSLALPGFLKLGGAAADLLRAGVTRTPLYIARKLIREPMAAAFTGGLNNNAFSAIFKAGAEFLRMSRGTSDAQAKLIEKGLIQSNIFAGDMSDMKKMALQLASGKDQNVFERVFAAADRYAMRADAATLALVLKNAEANGLSEVEADMMTMESMNFYKRGLSPTLQYASRLIPFFNAQIQGLNVLVKAARGNMPFEEQQEIKRKFYNNAILLMGTGLVYAMAMEDDETFRNARPRDKYSNFFLPIPGVDEPLKLPIPFEAGYFFSLAVAAVDGMRAETDGKAQFQALRDMFLGSIPGYSSMGVPQLVKPVFEVWLDKNFLTGAPVEPRRLQGVSTEERYLATTTELAKQMSKALPILSPIQIEHIVRGYLGVLPLVAAAAANSLFEREGKGEKAEARASDLPLIGTAFQKKYGGGDADVVYREAQEAMQARDTLSKMLSEGRREEAAAYREKNREELALASAAGQYRQVVGRINSDIRRTQERDDLTAEEKRLRLDMLEKAKQDRADAFLAAQRRIRESLGG